MRPVRLSFRFAISSERRGSAPPYDRRAEPGGSRGATGSASAGRAGATLTEILMAILIMAIGVVSVFTLFPISVLRTIQATQQTNSKIHKLNVQQLVKSSPGVLTQFNSAIALPLPYNFQGEPWRPNTAYPPGAIIVPTMNIGQVHPEPLVWYTAVPVVDLDGDTYFESGINEPGWLPTTSVIDGELEWQPVLDAAGIPLSYVVDPLGFHIANDDAASPPAGFGNKTAVATGVGTTPPGGSLLRIHGGIASTTAAIANVSQLDSWEDVFSGTPLSTTFTTVTFPPGADLSGITAGIRRLVITSTDGTKTVYRAIGQIDPVARVITLDPNEPISNSPAAFPQDGGGNPDIGIARVEVFNRRFTWFLTVRNSASGDPDIKCVVVFNRNFGSASEHVYDANFGDASDRIDIDNFGGPDATQHGLSGNAWVKIAWPNTEPKPLLKPGNWLFDARDVTWYRIQEVFDEGTGGGVNFAVLLLDRGVRRSSQPAGPVGQAILMPGIVEIFNL